MNKIITPEAFFKENADCNSRDYYKIHFLENEYHLNIQPVVDQSQFFEVETSPNSLEI